MNRKLLFSVAALAFSASIPSLPAVAASSIVNGFVQRVLVTTNGDFGGCMAMLTVDPKSKIGGCKPNWVSFGCIDTNNPVLAYRALDQAQLAMATGQEVGVWFTNDTLYNGF